jgi:hypothetical protein
MLQGFGKSFLGFVSKVCALVSEINAGKVVMHSKSNRGQYS